MFRKATADFFQVVVHHLDYIRATRRGTGLTVAEVGGKRYGLAGDTGRARVAVARRRGEGIPWQSGVSVS